MRFNPFQGRYLFHFHTLFTDGKLSVADYFEFAQRSGTTLLFLEHIRSNPSFNVNEFCDEVAAHACKSDVSATIGFEAKLNPDGTLDVNEADLSLAEVVGIAEHGFPNDCDLLVDAFLKTVAIYRTKFPKKQLVWVHPGLWFQKRQMEPSTMGPYKVMQAAALRAGVLVERNLRYNLVSKDEIGEIPSEQLVIGADAHNWADLERWRIVQRSAEVPTASSYMHH